MGIRSGSLTLHLPRPTIGERETPSLSPNLHLLTPLHPPGFPSSKIFQ